MAFYFKRTLLGSLLSISFATSAASALQPEAEHASLITEMLKKLSSSHYQKRPVNDQFSSDLYREYLNTLDRSKSYFLEADIKQLEHWRFRLDDEIQAGRLDYAFDAFTLLRDISTEQLNRNIELLESDYAFNFDDKEQLSQNTEQRSWPKTAAERDDWWRKRIESELLVGLLNGEELSKARDALSKRYKREIKILTEMESRDIFSTYASVVSTLFDPHTTYFSPSTSDSFNINMSLSLEGIGAVLERQDDYIQVVRVVPGGPAAMQGDLKAGDKIIGITNDGDSEPTDLIGWRLDDAVNVIRGPKDSVAALQVIPSDGGSDTIKLIEITRDKVKLEEQAAKKEVVQVVSDSQEYQVGVITIPTFYLDFEAARRNDPNYKSTTRDVARLMGELINKQGVDGVVLDLRSNGGGSLIESTQLSDLFINPGPVVQIRSSSGQIDRTQRARRRAAYHGPLVVLIDRLSASASEIFAGAIQDYGRGLVVGSQSFGKGTVQTLLPLGEGQLKLTEAKFYRVSGDSTQNRGIIPDITFPGRYNPENVGESSQENALQWDTIRPAPHRDFSDLSDEIVLLKKSHKARISTDPDFRYYKQTSELKNRFSEENEQPVSLNLKEREALKKLRREQLLSLENERRKFKGLEVYADIDSHEAAVKDIDVEALPLKERDPLLMEASRIVADMIKLEQNPQRFAQQLAKSEKE